MPSHALVWRLVALSAPAGCQPAPARPPAPQATATSPPPLPLAVSVKDMMGGVVAFSAHVIERMERSDVPLSASDWGAARLAASDIMASATLLTTPNSNIVDSLRRRDEEWWPLAEALQEAGDDAASAARNRDRAALSRAAGKLNVACQSCHSRFKVHGQ